MWTIKFLEDNIEKNLGDFGYGDDFLDIKSKAQSRGRVDKVDFTMSKILCSMKHSV